VQSRKSILIEKLPINAFRLPFIEANFPDARYIFIYRDAIEVASSIERLSKTVPWFGFNDYKWHQLTEVATLSPVTAGLPSLCLSDFDRGLLEWRLGTEEIVQFAASLADVRWCALSYDELVGSSVNCVERILSFVGEPLNEAIVTFVRDNVARRTSKSNQLVLSERQKEIAGPLLTAPILGKSS
jgi:hypothetical protein